MGKDNREDIFTGGIEYSYISLISKKLRVGIIGGGKAGEIKARHFVNNKCYVEVLSKNFDEKIIELSNNCKEELKLIKGEFSYEFLRDKHLIIIAIDDETLKNKIKKFCDENYKIYIDSSNFKDGIGVVPIQKNTESIAFALNTKHGNPKGAALLSNKVKDLLEEYDDFINFIGIIRNKAKEIPEYKSDIVELTNNEVFKKAFDEGKSENMLREHLPKEIVDYLLKS
ncbi:MULTISPECIES: NAD(P)-dependent oxidoreductase [unclassified Clostridium]|uniref:NAD(P)-dependent oxidoreductase n=1 Tax=unclassified Clostridium TaxID=2614128 RepID=UPI0002978176|nr:MULTISPECIES: NAD(P)-dependent oxidoreductase [unclassified Clostridium]EKQ53266.1 MAG: siroheme synthase (precorrin-2 oxidase/ferrochelatase domain) [Clostridium sp. Maddingley MBC34-26]